MENLVPPISRFTDSGENKIPFRHRSMSTAQSAIKNDRGSDAGSRVPAAIQSARGYLLAQQNLDGYWWAELDANVTLTAEYIMLHRILIAADPRNQYSNGRDREQQIGQMARYLLRQQR